MASLSISVLNGLMVCASFRRILLATTQRTIGWRVCVNMSTPNFSLVRGRSISDKMDFRYSAECGLFLSFVTIFLRKYKPRLKVGADERKD